MLKLLKIQLHFSLTSQTFIKLLLCTGTILSPYIGEESKSQRVDLMELKF